MCTCKISLVSVVWYLGSGFWRLDVRAALGEVVAEVVAGVDGAQYCKMLDCYTDQYGWHKDLWIKEGGWWWSSHKFLFGQIGARISLTLWLCHKLMRYMSWTVKLHINWPMKGFTKGVRWYIRRGHGGIFCNILLCKIAI